MQPQFPVRSESGSQNKRPLISKSKFLWGRQCPKLLWTAYNAQDLIPAPDASLQAVFDQGHQVGALAKNLYTDGLEIKQDAGDFQAVLDASRQAVAARRPLFEAAFQFNGAYARADILNPVGKNGWELIEVKSTTELKDAHLPDLALQHYVYVGAGLDIRRCALMHIHKEYVRRGPVAARQFFRQAEVTDQVKAMAGEIEKQLGEFHRIIRQRKCPKPGIGPHCDDPYTCPLHDRCWAHVPDASVFTLYRGGRKSFDLYTDGVLRLADIPDNFKLTGNQQIQRQTAISGQPHVDRAAIARFLETLKYPLWYLDFETFNPAIPLFDGVRPYQQVPFQFSLHRQDRPGGQLAHTMFLADGNGDPRLAFIQALQAAMGEKGSVVVYNASFEKSVLDACAEAMPSLKRWVTGVKQRMVDLLGPFRSFHYYHPAQQGSASIKAVMPALTRRGYEGLEIQEGGTASLKFLTAHVTPVAKAERQRVRQQLEAYCRRDTEGMIWIVDALRNLAEMRL